MSLPASLVGTRLPVGIGQVVVSTEKPDVLVAYGLGSCVGIAAYDDGAAVAGMAHVLLPESEGRGLDPLEPARYGDLAVASLLEAMAKAGARSSRLIVKLAGGASVLGSSTPAFRIGERNAESIREQLRKHGIPVRAEALGGSRGRTLELHAGTGKAFVRMAASQSAEF